MTLLVIDSTALLTSDTTAGRRGWTRIHRFNSSIGPSYQQTGRRTGGLAISTGGGASPSQILGAGFNLKPDGTALASSGEIVVGFAAKLTRGQTYSWLCAVMGEGSSSSLISSPAVLSVTSGGIAKVGWKGSSAAPGGTVTSGVSSTDSWMAVGTFWYYMELKYKWNSSTNGAGFTLHIDGTERALYPYTTGAGLGSALLIPKQVGFFSDLDSNTASITDIYVLDTSTAPNNDFLGDCRVEYLAPTAVGTRSDWTPTGGTALSAVTDSSGSDGDTSYISTSVVNAKQTYTLTDLGSTAGTVKAVAITALAKKTSSAPSEVDALARISGVDYQAAVPAQVAQTDYRSSQSFFETNPATSAAWTAAQVNALEAGVIRTT